MKTDGERVRQLAADLRVIARNDLTGGQRVCSQAAAILERLANWSLMDGYAGFYDGITAAEVIDAFRDRVMGED